MSFPVHVRADIGLFNPARIPESVRIPSIMRTPKLEADAEAKTRPKPNSGKGSQQPATVTDSSLSLIEGVTLSCEQHLGPMTLAAAYSSADVWTAGMGTKLGSDWEVKGRMNSQNRGAGVLRGKLGENAEVRVSCEVCAHARPDWLHLPRRRSPCRCVRAHARALAQLQAPSRVRSLALAL
eukprot:1860855-Rhodomonas_salina.1